VLDIYLKGYSHPEARAYLSEGDLEIRFSLPQRMYYSLLRPVVPLRTRQWLQKKVNRQRDCRQDFIWSEFVDLVQSDADMWERFTSAIYPQGYETAIVMTHDVETQRGYDFIPKVIELETRYGFRSSWNLVAYKYRLHPDIVNFIQSSGHEIGIHGYNHDGTEYYSERRFMRRARYVNQALQKYGAVGFRSPQMHRNLAWLQSLNILYDASCFDYDPYQPFPGGTGSIWPFMAGRLVELPYTVPQDHTIFCTLNGTDISIWKNKTEWLLRNRGMVLTLTHPDYLQDEGRMNLYEEYLAYLRDIPRAWHCLPREMAERYRSL